MLIAKRIKDLHSPDTQVCSLTLYSLWMPYIPIGVLEPFLLVLNPVKASAKVFVFYKLEYLLFLDLPE